MPDRKDTSSSPRSQIFNKLEHNFTASYLFNFRRIESENGDGDKRAQIDVEQRIPWDLLNDSFEMEIRSEDEEATIS